MVFHRSPAGWFIRLFLGGAPAARALCGKGRAPFVVVARRSKRGRRPLSSTAATAHGRARYRKSPPIARSPLLRPDLIEDRRTFDPFPLSRPIRKIRGTAKLVHRASPVTAARRAVRSRVPTHIAFADPRRVAVCIRRKIRKQVLFAIRGTGKGARSKRRRQTSTSQIGC